VSESVVGEGGFGDSTTVHASGSDTTVGVVVDSVVDRGEVDAWVLGFQKSNYTSNMGASHGCS